MRAVRLRRGYDEVAGPLARRSPGPFLKAGVNNATSDLAHTAAERAGFEIVEQQVIMLARHDRLASIARPRRLLWLAHGVFGWRAQTRLANPRLEALRQLAVWSWRKGVPAPAPLVAAFGEAGFSAIQYRLLATIIADAQPRWPAPSAVAQRHRSVARRLASSFGQFPNQSRPALDR